jgi:ribonuclease HI|uniref:RNase H type-1 domain-containing protein n=1 Tax=viral metagenome TaxID=1070528 RepID=A0A6C0IMF9_9ZZZZ
MNQCVYTLYFDGCSKGNPGRAGAGYVIYKDDEEISYKSTYVGDKETNNKAEYTGAFEGLRYAVENNIKCIHVKGDSNLVIKQLTGEYKVKSENIMSIYRATKQLCAQFDIITFEHVYRKDNARADHLANLGLEQI